MQFSLYLALWCRAIWHGPRDSLIHWQVPSELDLSLEDLEGPQDNMPGPDKLTRCGEDHLHHQIHLPVLCCIHDVSMHLLYSDISVTN